MKKLIVLFTLVLAVTAGHAALPQPDLIAQVYFAGAGKISATPNVNAFTNEFCSAPALALRQQTAGKLAGWLAGWLQSNAGTSVPDGAARLRPLFDDLQKSEWMLEARAVAAGRPEVALAIKLDSGRAQSWQAGLKPFLPAASFTTTSGWLIFDSGTGSPKLGTTLAQKVMVPHAGWFSLDVNWPHLARWFPELGKLGLPETMFTVTAPDANFHVDGTFFYPQPLALNLEAWKFPTNLVHQLLTSFTAVRGFAPWLASQDWAQPYQLTPAPNQAFIWALRGIPFETYAAVPVPDSAGALAQMYARLQPIFNPMNAQNISVFKPSLQRTNDMISVLGLPMVVPYFQAINKPSGQYLFAGGFPNVASRKPLPPELFQRLAIKNLAFYHWEITSERVSTMLQPMQLGLLSTGHVQLDGKSTAYKWLNNLAPQLGNTTTEITQAAPDQLAFTRTAPGVFTAAELYVLANWLEAKNFPGCDLKLPPVKRIKRVHPNANIPTVSPPSPTK